MDLQKIRDSWTDFRDSREFNEFYFLAIALVLAFGILATTGTALKTDKPVVTVISCSMYPTLDVGDVLLVRGEKFDNIHKGGIIVYDAPQLQRDVPVVHRIIRTHPDYVETQGDNVPIQQSFEKHITPEQIHGVVAFDIPKIGIVKLLAMDLVGIGPDNRPLVLDTTPQCVREV
ncbi:MAG: signal peptidase I [Candidatus Nanohaloarchaea archaeon]